MNGLYFRIQKRNGAYIYAIECKYLKQEAILNAKNILKTIKNYIVRKYFK